MAERDVPHPDDDRAAVVAPTGGAAGTVARWLGESGELMSRYSDAVGQHVGRMASVNADLRSALARERRRVAALEAESERLRPVLDAVLLLAVTPSTHPAYEDRKSDSWAIAFEEAKRRGIDADAPGPGGEGEGQ